MNDVGPRTAGRRPRLVPVMVLAAATASLVVALFPPRSAAAIERPLRSSLASLPDTLGGWTRASDGDGSPIADRPLPAGGEACLGTDVHLSREFARNGRSLRLEVGYHSGTTLRTTQCTPERCWVAGGLRASSPATLTPLASGLEVMLVEFEHDHGGRTLAAYTFVFDGRRRAEPDTPGLARDYWTQVQLAGEFPPEDAATARSIFLADVEDLMPRVVAELQNNCLPAPVEAVPTG